jgi:NADPH-dependent 7-cyano-7-deazaguanine reductase QueF-like protein
MSQDLKHARVTTTIPQPDGSKIIETKSYYEELNSVQEEIQQSIKTNKATFVTDLMRCVSPISDGISKKITLVIEANDKHEPIRIVKTWTTHKEYYGR